MSDVVTEAVLLLLTGWLAGLASAYTLDGLHAWHKRRRTVKAFAHLLPQPKPPAPSYVSELDPGMWPSCSCGGELAFITMGHDYLLLDPPIMWLCPQCVGVPVVLVQ